MLLGGSYLRVEQILGHCASGAVCKSPFPICEVLSQEIVCDETFWLLTQKTRADGSRVKLATSRWLNLSPNMRLEDVERRDS